MRKWDKTLRATFCFEMFNLERCCRLELLGRAWCSRSWCNFTWVLKMKDLHSCFSMLEGWRCFDCRGSILLAPGVGVLSDYWSPCSGDYPDDQFSGVFPTNVKITLRRKYSKLTFPFPWSFFTQARPITYSNISWKQYIPNSLSLYSWLGFSLGHPYGGQGP